MTCKIFTSGCFIFHRERVDDVSIRVEDEEKGEKVHEADGENCVGLFRKIGLRGTLSEFGIYWMGLHIKDETLKFCKSLHCFKSLK